MTWTAKQTADWFVGHGIHWWGPNTSYVSPFTQDLGRPGEYGCADAVTDALLHAGIDIRQGCPGFCNCINLHAFMLAQPAQGHLGFKTVDIKDGREGDVVIFVVGGTWGHTGMLRAPTANGVFHTIENDTSSPDHPEWTGCGVCTPRDRKVSDWAGKMHVFRPTGYATTAAADLPDTSKGYSPFTPAQLSGLAKLLKSAGDTKSVVEAVQKHLNGFHGASLVVDGDAGKLTIAALQRVLTWLHPAARLAVDGVFGPVTSAALSDQISTRKTF